MWSETKLGKTQGRKIHHLREKLQLLGKLRENHFENLVATLIKGSLVFNKRDVLSFSSTGDFVELVIPNKKCDSWTYLLASLKLLI